MTVEVGAWQARSLRCVQIVRHQIHAIAKGCETVGAFAAVGVLASAGLRHLIEWLKGVRSYEPGDAIP